MDGIAALAILKEKAPPARSIILTVFDDVDKIFRDVCAGASGYILKSSGIDQIGEAIRKEIGYALGISMQTVSTHIQRVYEKLHARTNTGAVAKALREKLI